MSIFATEFKSKKKKQCDTTIQKERENYSLLLGSGVVEFFGGNYWGKFLGDAQKLILFSKEVL